MLAPRKVLGTGFGVLSGLGLGFGLLFGGRSLGLVWLGRFLRGFARSGLLWDGSGYADRPEAFDWDGLPESAHCIHL